MRFHAQIVQFPVPSLFALYALIGVFTSMFCVAVLIEVRRRRRFVRAQLDRELDAMRRILDERRLSESEASTLTELVRRHAADAPLEAVATHSGYNRLVDKAIEELRRGASPDDLRDFGIVLRDIRLQLGLDSPPPGSQLASTRGLRKGQRISVASAANPRADWIPMTLEVVDEAYLYLVLHDPQKRHTLPKLHEEIRAQLWRDDDAEYVFTTTVEATDAPPPTIQVLHPAELRRTQTREHFRVRHDQSTTIGVLSASLSEDYTNLDKRVPVTRLRGRITSLSAGGCALVLQQSVGTRMLLRIELELPRQPALKLTAKVIACTEITGDRFLVRATFVGVKEEAQDAVARYVLKKQQISLASHNNPGAR